MNVKMNRRPPPSRARAVLVPMLLVLLSRPEIVTAHPTAPQVDVLHSIRRVRRTTGPNERTAAAEHLRDIVLATRAGEIDDPTIHDLASLLDIRLDSVRYWIAEALGHFDSRAQFAAPELRRILAGEECVIAESSSQDMIRQIL